MFSGLHLKFECKDISKLTNIISSCSHAFMFGFVLYSRSLWGLIYLIVTHAGDKPHSCGVCGSIFLTMDG